MLVAATRYALGIGGPVVIAALLLLGPCFAGSASADAIVRWSPSTDPTVVGYNVYVRTAGSAYTTARRAGLPARSADGSHTYRATQLPAATTRYFAVAGYRADGSESALSNELALGPTNPCQLDRCYSLTGCFLLNLPDGLRCGDTGADPCAATCSLGACGALLRTTLETGRLSLVQSNHGVRLGALGVMTVEPDTDIGHSGVSVTIESLDAVPVFQTYVPGDAFAVSRSAMAFRYHAPRGTKTGLLRLAIRRTGDRFRMAMRALVPEIPGAVLPDQVQWMVSSGSQCASATQLACSPGPGKVTCF